MKEFNPPPKEYMHWLSHKIYVAEKMTYSTRVVARVSITFYV